MKRVRLVKLLIVTGLVMVQCSCNEVNKKVPGMTPDDDLMAIEQTIRNNLGWAGNKDFNLLRSTIQLDSSYLVVNPTDRVAIGVEDFRANEKFFASPDFQAVGFEISDLHINVSRSGDVAWFYCHLNDWNTWKGEPANWENVRWTGVLEKIDGQWRIRQQHFSYAKTR